MTKRLGKKYKHGERISLYVSKDVSNEFLDWLNMQSNLTAFFYYSALKLYKETGKIDVATVMPAKLNYDLQGIRPDEIELSASTKTTVEAENSDNSDEEQHDNNWSGLNDLNDPYA